MTNVVVTCHLQTCESVSILLKNLCAHTHRVQLEQALGFLWNRYILEPLLPQTPQGSFAQL